MDGAIIATPNNTHFSVLKDILSVKSIPIISEKPLTSSLEDARGFLRLAHPLSAVNFNYRFNPIIALILEIKKNSALGEFIFIDIAFNKNSALTKKTLSWRDNSVQNTSSGAFGDLGSHLFDLVNYFSQSYIKNDSLKVSVGTRVKSRDGAELTADDHCVATGVTNNHIIFKVKASKTAAQDEVGFHLHLTCKHGEIRYSSLKPEEIEVSFADSLKQDSMKIHLSKFIEDPKNEIPYWSDSFYFQNLAWIKQIGGQLSPDIASILDGLKVQELLSTI